MAVRPQDWHVSNAEVALLHAPGLELHTLPLLILFNPYSHLMMLFPFGRRNRGQGVEYLAQGHRGRKWESWDLNPDRSVSIEPMALL